MIQAQKVQVEVSSHVTPITPIAEPEMETFEVELVKDQQGLGITIAGYVCEKGKFYVTFPNLILFDYNTVCTFTWSAASL